MFSGNICMRVLVVGLVFVAGMFRAVPSEGKAADPGTEIPPALAQASAQIRKTLDGLDASVAAAARGLAEEESLYSPRARSIIAGLCADPVRDYVVDCCTIDPAGRIVAMEPELYKAHEGADIADQEQVVRLHQTMRPVLSLNMRMVEGFDAVDLEWPIIGPAGAFKGSVSALIRPEALIAAAIGPAIEGLPVSVWVMQKNGRILYDAHEDEIGRDLFSDDIFKPYGQLLALGKRIADEPTGFGIYEYPKEGSGGTAQKRAHWTTVGLHGTDWRVVMTQVVSGEEVTKAGATPAHSVLSPLRALVDDDGFRKSLTAGDENEIMRMFEQFHKANLGLYSIEWMDAGGVVRFGYPVENSLRNYDMRASDYPAKRELMEVVDSRKEIAPAGC